MEGLPKIPSWWVLGAFGGSGDAFSWTRKAKLLIEQLKALSYSMSNLVRIPMIGVGPAGSILLSFAESSPAKVVAISTTAEHFWSFRLVLESASP